MNLKFRPLNTDEVECRVGQAARDNTWATLLLYKNARADMSILDETVGAENWEREHYECKGNLFCRVSINCLNEETGDFQWVHKSDCGTESNTEAEKGEASDSFKRACVNWGIGRELYTSPLIFIPQIDKKSGEENYSIKEKNGKPTIDANFVVTYIGTENGKITGLNIENTKKRKTIFMWGKINYEK